MSQFRVLYFGDPQGGLALLAKGLCPVGVVHGRKGGRGWRSFIPQVTHLPRWHRPDLEDPTVVAALSALKPDLIVAGFYPRIIPQAVLDLAPGINVHPSLLPRWRGPDPTHWTLRAGDAETGLCVHWLTAALDAGDVLLRETAEIRPRENAGALAARLETQGAQRLADVAARLAQGEVLTAVPQAGPITWAPLADPDEVEIDWTQPAATVDLLVRASAPWPGAYTGLGEELLVVLAGRPASAGRFERVPPGTPFVRDNQVLIRCGDEAYRLDRVKLGKRLLSGKTLAGLLV